MAGCWGLWEPSTKGKKIEMIEKHTAHMRRGRGAQWVDAGGGMNHQRGKTAEEMVKKRTARAWEATVDDG